MIGRLLLPSLNSKIRHFGDHNLSSRNQSVSQPASAAKFSAAGARPTLVYSTLLKFLLYCKYITVLRDHPILSEYETL